MDTKQIKSLMRDFDESGLSKVKITKEGFSIELEKAAAPVAAPVAAVAAPVAAAPVAAVAAPAAPAEITGDAILSPMVGTYYASPSPDSPAFVKVGDTVKKGQVVAILEAMKIMNELEAEFDCKILDILATNGQAVEYDMPIYLVEKI
ncbi:acetyl-CoA carboxylase biotin carboxyl carrier protein [bacterium]|nr:acetyl-CoA carboxylase biotin carboxyl carrier protein [bacterium]MBU1989356.1 acetyl-CoA carboxylase biotin carboxyl carrier protein [bacterium]